MARFLTPLLAGWALLLGSCAPPSEQDVANDDRPIAWVEDDANLLSPEAEKRISDMAIRLQSDTTDQIIVWTTPDLGGRSIEEVSLERARALGVGTAELDNGVMITVARGERRVRIEVGYGLEALLTDERAAEIIRNDMTPHFRAGDFDEGVEAGLDAIANLLRSDRERPRYRSEIRERMAS